MVVVLVVLNNGGCGGIVERNGQAAGVGPGGHVVEVIG